MKISDIIDIKIDNEVTINRVIIMKSIASEIDRIYANKEFMETRNASKQIFWVHHPLADLHAALHCRIISSTNTTDTFLGCVSKVNFLRSTDKPFGACFAIEDGISEQTYIPFATMEEGKRYIENRYYQWTKQNPSHNQ